VSENGNVVRRAASSHRLDVPNPIRFLACWGDRIDRVLMETSLHRELKEFYCDDAAAREVSVRGYRVDAIVDGVLIEIQQASLSALRHKTKALLETHRVIVVKPLSALKTIIRLKSHGGPTAWTRVSPRHETLYHLFDDFVHFVHVFPHPQLTLEVLLTEQEETRVPRPKRRFRAKDFTVADRRLIAVRTRHVFQTNSVPDSSLWTCRYVYDGGHCRAGRDSAVAGPENGVLPAPDRGHRHCRQTPQRDRLCDRADRPRRIGTEFVGQVFQPVRTSCANVAGCPSPSRRMTFLHIGRP